MRRQHTRSGREVGGGEDAEPSAMDTVCMKLGVETKLEKKVLAVDKLVAADVARAGG